MPANKMPKFQDVDNLDQTDPQTRCSAERATDPAKPVKWHRLARPAPAYALCLVKITVILTKDRIKLRCFGVDATLSDEVEVDLTDWDRAWRGGPTTIELAQDGTRGLPRSVGDLGHDNCGILCLSEEVLAELGDPAKYTFAKYPFAEDAVRTLANKLRAALRAREDTLQAKLAELLDRLRSDKATQANLTNLIAELQDYATHHPIQDAFDKLGLLAE